MAVSRHTMSSKEDRAGKAPHLRVIRGGPEEDDQVLEDGFHVIDDDAASDPGPQDPWQRAGGDPSDPDPDPEPGVLVDTDPTVLADDIELPPAREGHGDQTRPEIVRPGKKKARGKPAHPTPKEAATDPGPDASPPSRPIPEEMATVPRAPMPEPPESRAAGAALPRAQLRVLEGPGVGTTYAIAGPLVTLGRSSDCEVTLRDLSMSRRHAEVRRAGRRAFEVRDLGSRNGTTVDGRAATTWIAAAPGSVVAVGDVRLRLEVEDLHEPTLMKPGGLGIPLDPPLPPPSQRPRTPPPGPRVAPRPTTPAPRPRGGRSSGGRAGAPSRPAQPAPRAPAASGLGTDWPPASAIRRHAAHTAGAPSPVNTAALGTLAKGFFAVALGAGISVLLAWVLFFAPFAPFASSKAAKPVAGAPPAAHRATPLEGATPRAKPPAPAPAAPAAPAVPTAAATDLASAQAAAARQDWVAAVQEARLVPRSAPEHHAAATLLHQVDRDVIGPRLDRARAEIAGHHPDAAEETLLAALEIWPHHPTARRLLQKARAAERAALAPPPPAPHTVHRHRRARRHVARHRATRHHAHRRRLARHEAAPPPQAPAPDAGLLRKARQAFADRHLHSAIAAADAAADLGGDAAKKLDRELHAFESSYETASRTSDIATALGSYADALYRAHQIAPPAGGAYGALVRKALGHAHYVAALRARQAGRNQEAIGHAQQALHYDPTNRGARALLRQMAR